MKKIAKFASLILTVMLMFGSFSQVASADDYTYEGYMSSDGNVLKIKDGKTEVDGWCINLTKKFLDRWGHKNPLFKRLDPTAENLKNLVDGPVTDSAEQLLTRVKQVIKYSENHREELEKVADTFKGKIGFEDHRAPEKEAYFLAVQGAIWSLTDHEKAGPNPAFSRTKHFPKETQNKINDLVKRILEQSVQIKYFEYSTIGIGIYEAQNKKNQNILTREKPTVNTFQVKKTVTGLAGEDGKGKEFKFSYTCGDKKGDLTVKGNGDPVVAQDMFPIGTECTVKETGNADIEGYTLVKPNEQKLTIGKDKTLEFNFVNHYEKVKPAEGTFQVKKTVTGLAGEDGKGKEFKFSYTCGDKKGDLTVKGNGDPVVAQDMFPIGTECTVKETGNADIEGYTLVKPNEQKLTIGKDKTLEFNFVNHYEKVKPAEGTFQVKKTVTGLAGEDGKGKEFKFSYTCGDKKGDLTVKGNGDPVVAQDMFPIGTECTVKETGNADIEGYTLVKPNEQKLTIGKEKTLEFNFVNHYEKVKPAEGTFQVKKTVTGLAGEDGKGKEFKFSYTCGDKKGDLTVKGNGDPVVAQDMFPIGTECTVKETGNADIEGYTLVKPNEQKLTIGKDTTVVVAFDNKYTPKEAKVTFSKVVAGQGKELAGASLKVVEGEKADGKVVYEWMSEGQAKVFGLKSGVYTMVEDQAPLGYEKAEAITFRVSFDKNGGKVEVKQGDKFVAAKDAKVVMEDELSKAKVTFSKVVAGQGKELAGASLKVVEGEKADGKVVYEWMSEGQAKVFGLKSGVYTMVEDQAPLGYEKAEAITFRVSFDKNGGKVEVKQGDKFVAAKDAKVVMEDKPSLTPEKPKLPKTGLEIGALGIISLALIAAGGLIIRRKKTL
ncbi:LPXTG-motif cell wall anchor domain-containing protein [Arcanobacterium phocae]|uniref:LPXTG-motif cell wall anchor domain-containing protein n=1 Tax=Arcanobacterium phocae TaxID=131112 RepID=A0A1H2LEM3_9ACTO|nr:DUF5979 domain-containing protein [Arcanobacterium phocae]SDU79068.1 LPXTG-motif cell wall anchor domain-containing protein [Arcanobacterium phocae]